MYKNIQIRNALECVPRSQYFSVSREGKRLPQWKKKASERLDLKKKKKTTVKENVCQHWFVLDKNIATIT